MQAQRAKIKNLESNWDIQKLLELGVSPGFVSKLTADEARDFVKGLLYLSERSLSES